MTIKENIDLIHLIVLFIGISFLLGTSGPLVRYILNYANDKAHEDIVRQKLLYYDTLSGLVHRKDKKYIRDYTGTIIGKCENILVFVFIIFDQYTALALIFTAKTVVRIEAIRADPLYYLAGTMLNVTYSIIIALMVKFLINIG
jgi:hypothetical protein